MTDGDRHNALVLERKLEKRRRKPTMAVLINAQVKRVFDDRYGNEFPDDDAGRDDLFIALQVLAGKGGGEETLRRQIGKVAPWMTAGETSRLVDRIYRKPLKFTADVLARKIGLTDANRDRLGITTIGAIDAPLAVRLARRKSRKVMRRRIQRRAAGATPRAEFEANSKSSRKPWLAFNWSRAKWYRNDKPEPETLMTPSNLTLMGRASHLSQLEPSKAAARKSAKAPLAALARGNRTVELVEAGI